MNLEYALCMLCDKPLYGEERFIGFHLRPCQIEMQKKILTLGEVVEALFEVKIQHIEYVPREKGIKIFYNNREKNNKSMMILTLF